jgi:leucyl aminopeptidase (aminopeptidase T)
MKMNIGIEMRDEYKRLETAKGAMKFVRDFMLVKPGESVVINYDTYIDERVVKALTQAVYMIDGVPVVIYTPTGTGFYAQSKPPAPLASAVCSADVWIELSYAPIMHGEAYRQAVDVNGARYVCATGMDVEMLVNCINNIDIDKVIELGEYFRARLEASDDILIKTKNGTNLHGKIGGRKIRHSGIKASKRGYPVMLPGQTSWCPIEETINGLLVFDGAIFPPENIGLLSNPVILEFKEGYITNISGEGHEAIVYKNWIDSFGDPNMYRLAHYSQGFNPGVTKLTGRIVEDERVFGGMEFGIGSQGKTVGGAHWNAASHTDGVVLHPTIILDGEIFEEDGVYVDPKARKICQEMGVDGYC